jgi:hypothetical protein
LASFFWRAPKVESEDCLRFQAPESNFQLPTSDTVLTTAVLKVNHTGFDSAALHVIDTAFTFFLFLHFVDPFVIN